MRTTAILFITTFLLIFPLTSSSCPEGCLACQTTSQCTQCDKSRLFFNRNGKCVKSTFRKCHRIDDNGKCLECQAGHFLFLNLICFPVVPIDFCQNYDPSALSTICLGCAAPRILSGNSCLKEIRHCEIYDPATGFCLQCQKRFKLSATLKQCLVGLIKNCELYDQIGYCRQCDGLAPRLSSRRQACLPRISQCSLHSSVQNECIECERGFRKTDDGRKCLPEIARCEIYAISSLKNAIFVCLKCEENSLLIENLSGWDCLDQIVNCKNFDYGTKTCQFCNEGFELTNDSLICLHSIQNCERYSRSTFASKNLICQKCNEGFIAFPPSSGPVNSLKCIKIIPYCFRYDIINPTNCSECSKNTQLSADNLSCQPSIPNCSEYRSFSSQNDLMQCAICKEHFKLSIDFNLCQKVIDACLKISEDGMRCLLCEEKNRLNDDGQKCLASIDNCEQYFPSSEISAFFMCQKCLEGFLAVLGDSKCVRQIDFCLEIEVNPQIECKKCENGFFPSKDKSKCFPEIIDCLEYDFPNESPLSFKCKKCKDGFDFLDNGQKCLKQIAECLQRAESNFQCEKCAHDFLLSEDKTKCFSLVNNCLVYEAIGENDLHLKCKTCNDKFENYRDGTLCIKEIENCFQKNLQTFACEICREGFLIVQNGSLCTQIIENCEEYNNELLNPEIIQCQKCKANFELYSNAQKCISIIANCNSRDESLMKCNQCQLGHSLSDDGSKCIPRIDNCEEIAPISDQNPKIKCLKCGESFQSENQGEICIPKVADCILRDPFTFICTKCSDEKIPTTDGLSCLQNIVNCREYFPSRANSQHLICKKCSEDFELLAEGSLCLPFIANCKIRDSQNAICALCLSPYILTNDGLGCLWPIEKCRAYFASLGSDEGLLCQTCDPNYMAIEGGKKCAAVIDKCIRRNSLLLCEECSISYFPTSDGLKCLPIVSNCQKYTETSSFSSEFLTCVFCNQPLILKNNQCVELLKILNCELQNQTNGLCQNCAIGFGLTGDNLACLPKIAECLTYAQNSNLFSKNLACISCGSGKVPTSDGSQCLPSILNCDEYAASSNLTKAITCKTCAPYFEQEGSLCVRIGLPNCLLYYKEIGLCGVCETSFSLTDDSKACLPDIFFCISLDFSTAQSPFLTCRVCLSGFILSGDKRRCFPPLKNCLRYLPSNIDTKQISCEKCESLFVVQPDGSCTRKVIKNCKQISASTNLCSLCLAGHVLTSDFEKCLPEIFNCEIYSPSNLASKSLACEKCSEGAVLTPDGICYDGTIAYCTKFDVASKTCNSCDFGKIVTSDSLKCLNPIFNCESYETSNFASTELFCKTCKTGFQPFLSGKTCGLKVQRCLVYDQTTFTCKICAEGQHASSDGQLCLADLPHCLAYDFASKENPAVKCLQCAPQFMPGPQNLGCVDKVIENCASIDSFSGLCAGCLPKFRLTDDKEICLPEVADCRVYQESTKFSTLFQCLQCRPGFQLIAMFCFLRPIPFCETRELRTGLCQTCIEGKRPTDDGEICLDAISNCGQYAASSKNSEGFFCEKCLEGNFLFSGNCVTIVSNCLEYDKRYFYCVSCEKEFFVTNDGEKCLPKIANCDFYAFSTVETTQLVCMFCANNFSINDQGKSCSPIIQNVRQNSQTMRNENLQDKILVGCENGWMLTDDAKLCLPKLDNCLIYQSTSKFSLQNVCLKCVDGFKLEMNGEACLAVNKLQ